MDRQQQRPQPESAACRHRADIGAASVREQRQLYLRARQHRLAGWITPHSTKKKETRMSSPSANVLTITDNSATITHMSYVDGSANVTPKQSFNTPPSIQKNGKVFTITFECDRSGSSEVAQAFNNSSGGVSHEYAA